MTKIRQPIERTPALDLAEAAWNELLPPPPLPTPLLSEPNGARQKQSEALLGYQQGAQASTRRKTTPAQLLRPAAPQFNPLKDILWNKDGHVIDPNALRFDVTHYDETMFYIVLRDGKDVLGRMKVHVRPFGDNMCMVLPGLEPHARGRRLGALLYLIAADLVRERGQTLGSDAHTISPDAVRVWQNLERRGLAKVGNGRANDWSIDNAALARIVGPARAFFEARMSLEPPAEAEDQ